VEDGYEFFARRQLVTLFSAPNYCGEFDNAGAMMSVDETLMCSFQVTHCAARRCVWYNVDFRPHRTDAMRVPQPHANYSTRANLTTLPHLGSRLAPDPEARGEEAHV